MEKLGYKEGLFKSNNTKHLKITVMKKLLNSLFTTISSNKEKNSTRETPVYCTSNNVFTSADLWNIHRNGRVRTQRRFI
jgi:hypothetical protein